MQNLELLSPTFIGNAADQNGLLKGFLPNEIANSFVADEGLICQYCCFVSHINPKNQKQVFAVVHNRWQDPLAGYIDVDYFAENKFVFEPIPIEGRRQMRVFLETARHMESVVNKLGTVNFGSNRAFK